MNKLFKVAFAGSALALAGVIALTVAAQAATSTADFVKNASIGGNFEVASSKIALQKSSNTGVKQFAQHMVDDHTKANTQLTSLLASDPSLPQPEAALDAKHQKMIDKLNAAQGDDFDRLYVKEQTKAHHEAVDLFKDYAKKGDNASLKNFASTTLPTLQEHDNEVRQLKSLM